MEIGAEVILKATRVDGCTIEPGKFSDATFFSGDHLSGGAQSKSRVMDATAIIALHGNKLRLLFST